MKLIGFDYLGIAEFFSDEELLVQKSCREFVDNEVMPTIDEHFKNGTFPSIKIYLKYDSRKSPVIKKIKRISKPGLRVYVNKNEIPRISGGLGTSIISTSRGVMTGNKAREIGVGGEILCSIL